MKIVLSSLAAAGLVLCSAARADMVTDWNANLQSAIKTGLGSTPPLQMRVAAIVQISVFDAVNGIAGKYEPYFVREPAPLGPGPKRRQQWPRTQPW